MKYMGSKRRIAKYILPIILKDRKPGQLYIEPFVGGANVIDKVNGPRAGYDINKYLIAFLRELRDGFVPPDNITKDHYEHVKNNKEQYDDFFIGYLGFEFSFGATWFSGYRPNDNRPGRKTTPLQAKQSVLKQQPLLKGCDFNYCEYDKIILRSQSIIYCDPPYKGTTGYNNTDFDHDKFWQWCRDRSKEGHRVFISEYQAPDDFKCIWEKEQLMNLNNKTNGNKKRIERLFKYQ